MIKKRFLFFMVALLVALGGYADPVDPDLKEIITIINAQCPMQLGTLGELSSVGLEGGNMAMTITIDEDGPDFAAYEKDPGQVKQRLVAMASNGTGNIQKFMQVLAKNNAGLTMIVKGKTTGKTFSGTLSPDEVAAAAKTSSADRKPSAFFDTILSSFNEGMPMKLDEGMSFTKVYVDGKDMVMLLSFDESIYSVDVMKSLEDVLKESLNEMFGGNDPDIKLVMRLLKAGGIENVGIKYTGNPSGKGGYVSMPIDALSETVPSSEDADSVAAAPDDTDGATTDNDKVDVDKMMRSIEHLSQDNRTSGTLAVGSSDGETYEGSSGTTYVTVPPPPPPVEERDYDSYSAKDSGEKIFTVAEVQPSFKGNVSQWLSQHINYPSVAMENGIQGRVIVKFAVMKDGSLSHIQVIRSVDPALDREALRVVKAMPRWNPGMNNGQYVNVWFNLPVIFKLFD